MADMKWRKVVIRDLQQYSLTAAFHFLSTKLQKIPGTVEEEIELQSWESKIVKLKTRSHAAWSQVNELF